MARFGRGARDDQSQEVRSGGCHEVPVVISSTHRFKFMTVPCTLLYYTNDQSFVTYLLNLLFLPINLHGSMHIKVQEMRFGSV